MNISFKKNTPTKEVFVRFTHEDRERLKAVAIKEDTKLSEVVRVFTLAALEEYERHQLKDPERS